MRSRAACRRLPPADLHAVNCRHLSFVEVFAREALLVAQHQDLAISFSDNSFPKYGEPAVTAITVPHGRQRLHHAVCLSK